MLFPLLYFWGSVGGGDGRGGGGMCDSSKMLI